MRIRNPRLLDKLDIDDIYNKYFSNNEYPDFFNPDIFPQPFIVTDDDERIILAGGVKTIAEAVVVTDQSLSTRARFEALLQAMGSSVFIAQGMKYKQIHAFVNNDDKYVESLKKFGFKLIDAKLLVLNF